MHLSVRQIIVVLACLFAWQTVSAQTTQVTTGTLSVTARPKILGKQQALKQKRFYLFQGGREANKILIERLRAAKFTSRNCFYCKLNASPKFMDWLNEDGGNCDSPYCRPITTEDIEKVPEFQSAFQKGKTSSQFRRKQSLAETWLPTNLDQTFAHGLYDQRKQIVDDILKSLPEFLQSSMTDNTNAPTANFINIPLGSSTDGKVVLINLVPIEIGEKSYAWACELDLTKTKRVLIPDYPLDANKVKNCDVIAWDLPACNAGTCDQK